MYILKCSDNSFYTGSTKDLRRRFLQHQNGEGANYTKKRLPVELVYFEEYSRIDTAFYREKQIQGWCRKKKEALIKGELTEIHMLSECKNRTHYNNIPVPVTSAPLSDRNESNPVRSLSEINRSLSEINRSLSGVETTETTRKEAIE